jgi:hypothetical protein
MTDAPEPLAIGDIVKTNYETGPYRVVDIHRDCTSPNYVDHLNAGGRTLPRRGGANSSVAPSEIPFQPWVRRKFQKEAL